jgi:hypothetical protein
MEHNDLTIVSVYGHNNGASVIPSIKRSMAELPGSRGLLLSIAKPDNLPNNIEWKQIGFVNYLQYSVFMMHQLYAFIDTEYCLIVQDDGWVLDGDNFMPEYYEYDYIGAPSHCAFLPQDEGFNLYLNFTWVGIPGVRVVQNGGFSLRDPALMADIAARHGPPPDITPDPNTFPEDVFFASHCVHRGARMPTWAEANMFSTESNESPGVVGFHDGAKYCPKSTTLYTGHEGPSRKLVTIHEARADGHDVTDLVRLGIGAKCLRIGSGALIYPGANKLMIDGASWDLDNGYVKDEIVLFPK